MWSSLNTGNQSLLRYPSETTTHTRWLSGRKEQLLCFRWVSTPVSSLLSLSPPSPRAIHHCARLNCLDRAKHCGKVWYKSSGLRSDAWPQIRPACCLDASLCNLQGSRLSDSYTDIRGEAPSASGHACLWWCQMTAHHKAIKTWWVWGCSPLLICSISNPNTSFQLLRVWFAY